MEISKQKGFINVKGTDIYYESAGEGEALVLLHGFPLDSRMWDPQMDMLSKKFQVIRFDIRGLGKTIDPGLTFTLFDDISSLLQKLQIKSANFLGCSFGGYMGIEFVLAYPKMAHRLILVSSGGFLPVSEDMQLQNKRFREEWTLGNIDEALDINLHLLLDGPDQEIGRVQTNRLWLKEIYREIYSKELSQNRPTWLDPHPSGRLAEVNVPTLVISGELDHFDYKKTADMLAANIPNAKHITFNKSAHFPNIDSPNEFNDTIVSFLRNN
ncbi:alpha/beta fold hydrolase [Paenibacillus psychroresistens]|nr:alpha/beta hydrolase [Paenibacillus psychroresistens]